MNRQETFNRVASHLLAQGHKSEEKDAEGTMVHRYRGPKNTRCAIGCLIPGLLYDERMEGVSALHPGVYATFGAGREDLSFLWALQRVHDVYAPEDWPETLKMTAWQFDLDPRIVEEAR